MGIQPELRDELLKLPAEERQALADELYDSVVEELGGSDWESAWSDEIARRVQDIVDGKIQLVDAERVHAELRKEFRKPEE